MTAIALSRRVRALAAATRNTKQSRRPPSIAAVYDGRSNLVQFSE
jgi:hypothetical protein